MTTTTSASRTSSSRLGRVAVLTVALSAAGGGCVAVQGMHLPGPVRLAAYALLVAAAAVVVGAGPERLHPLFEAAARLLCAGLVTAGFIRAAFLGADRVVAGLAGVAGMAAFALLGVYGTAAVRQLWHLARAGN